MTTAESLEKLAELSRRYGADPDYVFLGGGNTSFKTYDELFIKPSGVALATIQPGQFLKLDRAELQKVFTVARAPDAPPSRPPSMKSSHTSSSSTHILHW